jgi:pimeloyl-ACP methyl ester carboxylesterase
VTSITVKRAFVETSNGQIHYREAGNGPPLLLLHMTNGTSAMYLDIMPTLASRFRVIAMDTLGMGDSDPPPEEFRIEDYTGSVVEFMDCLRLKRASVLGHHTGAAIAAELAASHPHRLDKLILSACPDRNEEERRKRREELRPVSLEPDGMHLLRDIWYDRQRLATSTTSVEMIQRLALMRLQGLDNSYKTFTAVTLYYPSERLPLIQAPTLLITGELDPLAEGLHRHINLVRDCTTSIIEDAGSFVFMEKPQEYASQVLDFLAPPKEAP